MWDGLFMLLSLSTVMAIASFLAGSLPLSFSLSRTQLRFITVLGTGVLVGTSLIVIIPEGIETLYSAGEASHTHVRRAGIAHFRGGAPDLQARDLIGKRDEPVVWVGNRQVPYRKAMITKYEEAHARREGDIETLPWEGFTHKTRSASPEAAEHVEKPSSSLDGAKDVDEVDDGPDDDNTEGNSPPNTPDSSEDYEEGDHDHEHEERSPHAYVGISLILGFILMYLIDALPSALPPITHPSNPRYRPLQISLANLASGLHHSDASADEGPEQPAHLPATTIGLVIHSLADGIALGASSTSSSTRLGLIIFLAIMLHKAPAAFGLTSVLLKQGISKRVVRTHLLVFSLAAPTGAFLTWIVVHMLGRSNLGGEEGVSFATGVVLLFSGGTFLYVAMHSMNESQSSEGRGHGGGEYDGMNGYTDSEEYRGGRYGQKKGPTTGEVGVAVIGMLVPLLTQIGHVH